MATKIGDKSCQSNFDKRSSDSGSPVLSYTSVLNKRVHTGIYSKHFSSQNGLIDTPPY